MRILSAGNANGLPAARPQRCGRRRRTSAPAVACGRGLLMRPPTALSHVGTAHHFHIVHTGGDSCRDHYARSAGHSHRRLSLRHVVFGPCARVAPAAYCAVADHGSLFAAAGQRHPACSGIPATAHPAAGTSEPPYPGGSGGIVTATAATASPAHRRASHNATDHYPIFLASIRRG